jgi:hypothetical protein
MDSMLMRYGMSGTEIWGMGLTWLLLIVVLVLAIATLIKYLRFAR